MDDSRRSIYQPRSSGGKPSKFKVKRRQTFHSQHRHGGMFSTPPMHFEVAELIRKPASNLSVPRIIPQRGSTASSITSIAAFGSTKHLATRPAAVTSAAENRSFLTVGQPAIATSRPSSVESIQQRRPSCNSTTSDTSTSYKNKNLLCPIADLGSAKARIPTPELLSSDTSPVVSSSSRSPSVSSYGGAVSSSQAVRRQASKEDKPSEPVTEDLDVQSIINERRPSKLKSFSPGSFYAKEQSADNEARTDSDGQERHYVSVGVGSSSVELRVFVDDSDESREAETQAGSRSSEPEVSGKRRRKSPGAGEDPKV